MSGKSISKRADGSLCATCRHEVIAARDRRTGYVSRKCAQGAIFESFHAVEHCAYYEDAQPAPLYRPHSQTYADLVIVDRRDVLIAYAVGVAVPVLVTVCAAIGLALGGRM